MLPRATISLSILAVLLCAGCRDLSLPTAAEPGERITGDVMAEAGSPFELAYGQEARLDDLGITIEFVQLLADTRCTGADCSAPGDARILAEMRRDSGSRLQFVLTIPGETGVYYYYGNVIQNGEERIRLLRLEPYPGAPGTPDPTVYRAFILVQI